MNADKLLDAIGEVEEQYIADAQKLRDGNAHLERHRLHGKTILLIAAVLIALMGLTVYAAGSDTACDWILNYLAGTSIIESDYRVTAMEEMRYNVNQTVVDNDCTVTLQAAVSDGYRAYLKFHISLPEGIDSSEPYYFFHAEPVKFADTAPKEENPTVQIQSYGWRLIPDDNPEDGELDLVMDILSTGENPIIPQNGKDWSLKLYELSAYGRNEKGEQFNKSILKGNWEFRYTYSSQYSQEPTEMIQSPFSVWAKRTGYFRSFHYSFPIRAQVKSFQLRSLSATCSLEYSSLASWEYFTMQPIYIVMKDGTATEAIWSGGGYEGENKYNANFKFNEPIYFPSVDYILFPGNIRASADITED